MRPVAIIQAPVRRRGSDAVRGLLACILLCTAAVGQEPQMVPHGAAYAVSQFEIEFSPEIGVRPSAEHLLSLPVALTLLESGYAAPLPGDETVHSSPAQFSSTSQARFHASALEAISQNLMLHFALAGYTQMVVRPHPADLDDAGRDLRPAEQAKLRLLIGDRRELAPWKASQIEPRPTRISPRHVQESLDPSGPVPPSVGVVRGSARHRVKPTTFDGGRYRVERITLQYAEEHSQHPPLDSILESYGVYLMPAGDGYVGGSLEQRDRAIFVKLSELRYLDNPHLYASAIQQISAAIVDHFVGLGFIGINVSPHPEDIGPQAQDLRAEGNTTLRLVIRIGRVADVRTLASGDRLRSGELINHPQHVEIRQGMPLKTGDLLRKNALDNYISYLNRHPGRRVDIALSPARQPGGAVVDLLVAENKPWTVYGEVSNTGTEETSEWRERFGFSHNQVTNNDDILSLDYVTAGFDAAHAVIVSYEAPLFDVRRVRWRATGFWSQFTASEVGFAGEAFEGDEWSGTGELLFNVFQHKELFVDLIAGVRYQSDSVRNTTLGDDAREQFLLPLAGVQVQRSTEAATTSALVQYEINVLDVDRDQLRQMGRLLDDASGSFTGTEHFSRVVFDASQSLFLEPLLWREEWESGRDPAKASLAHEVYLGLQGQWSPDRNIPQFERTAGGLYSVRGYDESVVAGDTVVILNVEYRFHVPRVFTIEPSPRRIAGRPFRYAPQQLFGRPDWDWIIRGFFDYAQTYNVDQQETFEGDFELMSVGLGTEVLYKRHVNIRLDWGLVLRGAGDRADAGDDRLHIVATFLY
jgi:hypothetical protein